MKKLLIILLLIISGSTYAQTTFTQTFVDRCTGEVRVVTANFVNGSATVAFYNKIRTFTYQEFLSGELQQWLNETYTWWETLSPCSSATAETQTAQQTAQNATQAASTASTAASTSAPTTNTTNNASSNTTNNTSSTDTSSSGTTESSNTDTSNTTESSSSESSSSSDGGESSGGEEGSSESSESESENSETESESEESSEESSEEESDEGEGGDDDEDSNDGEESEEEDEDKVEMLPIQLRADMMGNQSLLGGYDVVMSMGATQSSIFGDVTYGATAMIWSNLNQFSINGSYTKVHMEKFNVSQLIHQNHSHYSKGTSVTTKDPLEPPQPKVSSITSASLGYMNNFGNGTIVASVNKLKPMGKWGTAGVGMSMVNLFGEGKYQMTMIGYNLLYTNMVMVSPRIQYAPAIIWTQSPFMGRFDLQNQLRGTEIDGMVILANSFTLQLTRRFSVNVGATFIKSTNPIIPLIKSFMIGTKLPF